MNNKEICIHWQSSCQLCDKFGKGCSKRSPQGTCKANGKIYKPKPSIEYDPFQRNW